MQLLKMRKIKGLDYWIWPVIANEWGIEYDKMKPEQKLYAKNVLLIFFSMGDWAISRGTQ